MLFTSLCSNTHYYKICRIAIGHNADKTMLFCIFMTGFYTTKNT